MIEVFKTDVNHRDHARLLIKEIRKTFSGYAVNFDLDDCDRILRVKSVGEDIQSVRLISLLKHFGFHAEVLPDECTESLPGLTYTLKS